MTPSAQLEALTNTDVRVVRYVVEQDINNDLLSELLVAWRDDYDYEIDGVVCYSDAVYPRTTGNPEHAFAFKMALSDQMAEVKVRDVIWSASKDGYLKPRVQIDPVVLGGAKIEFATGFNAKFIEDNKIGVGAVVQLIRSGDVIPHIIGVIKPAVEAQMPGVPYKWNATHVDILLENKTGDRDVNVKTVTGFFKALGVEGMGPGRAAKLVDAGFDTTAKIIGMAVEDYLALEGFGKKTSEQQVARVRKGLDEAPLPVLMRATNIFGRGAGKRILGAILKADPGLLIEAAKGELTPAQLKARLEAVNGVGPNRAGQIVDAVPVFVDWLRTVGLEDRLSKTPTPPRPDDSHPMAGKKFASTGKRDKDLIAHLEGVGADHSGRVRDDIEFLIAADPNDDSTKVKDARKHGVEIITPAEARSRYM